MARKIIKPVFSRPREIRLLSQEDSFSSYLLAYCLAEGASLTADGAKGGGGVATLIAGLVRPNLWQQYGCNFYQGVLAKHSLALEKARKSVLREMPIRRFLFGNSIGYSVRLRIKRSSVRIRPWPLRWVLGQGSLLPLSQGEAFTLASISYLAILVKYILAKKKKKNWNNIQVGPL